MLYLTVPLVTGIIAGYLLRGRRRVDVSRASVVIIFVLIFSLGFSIGTNSKLLNSLPSIGVSALAIATLSVAFSVLFAILIGRKLKA
jgi:uncharacterized membrane protein YbjE (DUF340 family)